MSISWNDDVLRPATSTPLAIFDNYEIYDVVLTNYQRRVKVHNYYPEIQSRSYRNAITKDELFPIGVTPPSSGVYPPIPLSPEAASFDGTTTLVNGTPHKYWTLYQEYAETLETTPERLVLESENTNRVYPDIYAVQRYTPYGVANTGLIYNLFDEYKPIIKSPKISWKELIIEADITYTGIASVSGSYSIEYWSRNYLEGHPRIDYTLDYWQQKVRLTKGKRYSFKLYHPVAHTLVVPPELQGATATGRPPIVDILASNRRYADSIPVAIEPPNLPPSGQVFKNHTKYHLDPLAGVDATTGVSYRLNPPIGWSDPDNPPPSTQWIEATYEWVDYRVLRATNQVLPSTWGTNANVGDYPDISTSQINQWHFDQQPDGSNGTIIMDSIRTLRIFELVTQIADAIDAATYATDPATGEPRVANLGHLVEKVANFIGYRPAPDGTIDLDKETAEYAAAVVPATYKSGSDYLAGRFGKKGLLLKRAPNKMGTTGKWEPGGYVKVHDLAQLHTELFGQLNQALNLQDSTSITIRDGTNTYQYPNQLALLTEIGTSVVQQRRQVREIWASSITTQKTVNEVLAGFGLPVVSKSIAINGQQLPYWAIQPNQSLQKEIATATYQGGAQLGQLL